MVLSTATQSHHVTKSISGILAAADAGEPGIEKLLLAALSGLKVPNLEQLIAAGNLDQAMAAVAATQISPADLDTIADLISAITLTVARPEAVALNVVFNEVNERTIRWAKTSVARNIVGVTPANLTIIRNTITLSLEAGTGPRVAARHIQDLIGLTPGHEKAVNRLYFSSLEDGVSVSHARRIAARKAKKLLRWRANMIARSETITAANMGQQLTWETALDNGLLPQGTKKIWVATGDNRTCPICAVLDGTVIEIMSSFAVNVQATKFTRTGSTFRVAATKPLPNPSTVRTPKAHFMCRCAMRLERL